MEKTLDNSVIVSRLKLPQDPNLEGTRRPIEELLSPEVIAEATDALKRSWLSTQPSDYRELLKPIWSLRNPLHPEYQMLFLERIRYRRGSGKPCVSKRKDYLLLNKATVFYWTESARNKSDPRGLVILGSIWDTWVDALGREPHTQLDEFFAVPVSVEENEAKTIPEILRAHKYIYAQGRNLPEQEICSKLLPLCEALITVFDEYNFVPVKKHADNLYHYDDVARHQSILLVRTGVEDKLSGPISFDVLKHEALSLARCEDMGSIDITRVPLKVGIRFVASLWLREEAAFPELFLEGPYVSNNPDHPIMRLERHKLEFIEERFAHAQEQGKILPSSTALEVKKAVMQDSRLEERPPNFDEPLPIILGWT